MRFDWTVAGIVMVALIALSGVAIAQVVRGEMVVSGGVATDQRGLRSNAITVAPSILLVPDPHFSAGLALSGTQFGSSVRALGGSGSLGARLPLSSALAVAASASGSATKTSFDATYASAELTPTLEAIVAGVTLFAGGHFANGTTSFRQMTSTPANVLGAPTVTTRDVSVSRTSAGAVFGGVLKIAGSRADEGGAIGYREERARIEGVHVTDRVATGTVSSGAVSLSASGGLRYAPDEQTGFGSVSATMALGKMVALQGAVGSYPSNRVTGTLGGRFASIGVVLHGLRRLDSPAPEVPQLRGAPSVPRGATRLAIGARDAKRVELAGDWNKWTPTPATRAVDGMWYADVRLPQGEYRYAFKIDGRRWDIPDGVISVDDGFGGRSAIVTVR